MAMFVLIPGAGGSAWYWKLVEDDLRALGHGTIAVEMPASDESAGLDTYVATVIDAMGDRTGAVVVGQSMGGLTAPIVAVKTHAAAIVLLNAMILKPGETGGTWWENTGQPEAMRENAARIGLPDLSMDDQERLFGHDLPADLFAEASRRVQPQSGRPFADPWPLERWPDIPTRVITSRDDRLFPADFQQRVARERLRITPELIDGGHLAALSHPREVVQKLDSYTHELGLN